MALMIKNDVKGRNEAKDTKTTESEKTAMPGMRISEYQAYG